MVCVLPLARVQSTNDLPQGSDVESGTVEMNEEDSPWLGFILERAKLRDARATQIGFAQANLFRVPAKCQVIELEVKRNVPQEFVTKELEERLLIVDGVDYLNGNVF